MRIFAVLAGFVFSATALAAEPAAPSLIFPYIEGKDYVVLERPVPPANPAKIEVAEVFSYLCSHCYHFDPLLIEWMKKQSADVALVQVHASWNPVMEAYQRGFYAAQALKVKEKAHAAIFKAIHEEQKEFKDTQAWVDFLSAYGVSKQAALTAYQSDAVTNQMKHADQLFKGYQISGTPELVIEGKYRISTRFTGSQEAMLKVAQYLVNKARTERAAKR